ncbi:hypothetical protein EG829_27560 [bacterium]|nr:hypothetical protein [bacterium]
MARKYPNTFKAPSPGRDLRIDLLVVDPQIDFCFAGFPEDVIAKIEAIDPLAARFISKFTGSLAVKGAAADMDRVAAMIERLGERLTAIHVTLDNHHPIDIGHPVWFKDRSGRHPPPLSVVTARMLREGELTTTHPEALKRTIDYEDALEASGRYPHVIWPPHCKIGSVGSSVYPILFETLVAYEKKHHRMVDYIIKGTNPYTEHYSAVKAEVVDPEDPGTMLNMRLIDILQNADVIPVAGEAHDYCVANTVRDIMHNFGEENIEKMVILTDCTSAVGTPAGLSETFMEEFIDRGGKTCESTEFFA